MSDDVITIAMRLRLKLTKAQKEIEAKDAEIERLEQSIRFHEKHNNDLADEIEQQRELNKNTLRIAKDQKAEIERLLVVEKHLTDQWNECARARDKLQVLIDCLEARAPSTVKWARESIRAGEVR